MNLKEETLKAIERAKSKVLWAEIELEHFYGLYDEDNSNEKIILAPGHTNEEYEQFIDTIDFDYDNGYGAQYVYGYIVFEDDSWLSREEYDGSEWWRHNKCPLFGS